MFRRSRKPAPPAAPVQPTTPVKAPAAAPVKTPPHPPAMTPPEEKLPAAILANTPINSPINAPISPPVTPPAAYTFVDVAAEAKATSRLLDMAINIVNRTPKAIAAFYDHQEELDKTTKLVHKVEFQSDMQTPNVGRALGPLKAAVGELTDTLIDGSYMSGQLGHVMSKIVAATRNLKDQLPGDVAIAENNEATDDAWQINGFIGKTESHGRVYAEAKGNKVKGGRQINGAAFGGGFDMNAFFGGVKT
ncbi:hypothetical protein QBC34DRAFT_389292 [Podospora aff. communis PSN243]|uniref:Uncharacterized protein n=1 Tax=Podospora aff. communis PSN243 TaxID=3040156 RepID=A0AAV9H6N7_9PEZI|nr:hypothetical protein QBC34DRAFT_389292 [Podospora aff. communis PSN243]